MLVLLCLYTNCEFVACGLSLVFVFVFVLLFHFNLLGSHIFSVNKNNVNSKFRCSTLSLFRLYNLYTLTYSTCIVECACYLDKNVDVVLVSNNAAKVNQNTRDNVKNGKESNRKVQKCKWNRYWNSSFCWACKWNAMQSFVKATRLEFFKRHFRLVNTGWSSELFKKTIYAVQKYFTHILINLTCIYCVLLYAKKATKVIKNYLLSIDVCSFCKMSKNFQNSTNASKTYTLCLFA